VAAFRKVAYYFFVVPCFLTDKTKTSDRKDLVFDAGTFCDMYLGYRFVAVFSIILSALGIVLWLDPEVAVTESDFIYWALSFVQIWVVWYFFVFTVEFYPHPKSCEWFHFVNKVIEAATLGVIDTRIGRWHLDRAFVHKIIRDAIAERGVYSFFLPEQHKPEEGKFVVTVETDDSSRDEIAVPPLDNGGPPIISLALIDRKQPP
jgi:hypothetical protein